MAREYQDGMKGSIRKNGQRILAGLALLVTVGLTGRFLSEQVIIERAKPIVGIKEDETNKWCPLNLEPHYADAFDNSKVLVIPKQGGAFEFYRDNDRDGYADTHGEGFYFLDLPRISNENTLPQHEYKMEDLEKMKGVQK